MSGQQKVIAVAIGMVVFSLVSILLLLALTDGAKIIPRAIRFVFTGILAVFLIKGAPWSRWLVGILYALGLAISVIGFFGLNTAGGSMFSILGVWMLVMAVFYSWVSYMLFFDKDVSEHFNPSSGF